MTKTIVIDTNEIKNRRSIVVCATESQLDSIKEIVPQLKSDTKKIKSFGDDIYELELTSIEIDTPAILLDPTLNELKRSGVRNETMLDFEGSEEFYRKAKSIKGFSIISDEYSNDRNTKLYGGFSKIESNWRAVVAKDEKARKLLNDEAFKPRVIRKGRDHILAQYDLSEFFETFFFSRPSDEYLKDYWNNDSDKNAQTAIKMTKLTRISELKVSLSQEELTDLQKRRNVCMHFRTVTLEEYKDIVEVINKYLKKEQMAQFLNSMDSFYKSMSGLTTSPVVAMSEAIRKITTTPRFFS